MKSKIYSLANHVFKIFGINPAKERALFALKYIGRNKKILDVGCSTGFIGYIFRKYGNHVTGIDIDKKAEERAKQNLDEFLCCDVRKGLPFENGLFDCIFAGEFIEHLDEKEGENFLKECYRVLENGGVLILTTPNPSWFFKMFRSLPVENIKGHKKCYTASEIIKKLESVGFSIEDVKGLGLVHIILRTFSLPLNIYGCIGVVCRKLSL